MSKSTLFGKPDMPWLIAAVIACVLLGAALFVPLWRMELVAPQYPAGLVMRAYGYKFVGDAGTYYDDVREINGLNHYIGMKPIRAVTEMQLFVPGIIALIVATLGTMFVAWKRAWFKALVLVGFWTMPLFFVADLQFWLYRYGHTMNPEAPLNTGSFTPKVFGTTKVWNFHSQTGFEIGFWLMLAAAIEITVVPFALRWWQHRRVAPARTAPAAGQQGPSGARERVVA